MHPRKQSSPPSTSLRDVVQDGAPAGRLNQSGYNTEIAPSRELSSATNLENDICIPFLFSSPFPKSMLSLLCPNPHHARAAFSSLSTLAFLSVGGKRQKNDPKSTEDQLPVSTGSSLASALATVIGSLLYSDKASYGFTSVKLKGASRPRKQQIRIGTFYESVRDSDSTASRNSFSQNQTVENSEEDNAIKESAEHRCINPGSRLGERKVVQGVKRVQNGGNLSIEKVQSITKHLVAGAVSTIVARTFVAPLERLKLEYVVGGAKHNWVQVIHGIWLTEGPAGFWKGNMLNLLRMVPFKSINFLAYDMFCKEMLERQGKNQVTNFDRLTAGAASGAAATLLCFPLDTIRTRLIAPGGEDLGGMFGCFHQMIHKEGALSLYKGLLPALLSMVPSGAVFYGVYDILKASYLQSPKVQRELQLRMEAQKGIEVVQDGTTTADNEGGKKPVPQLELGPVRTLIYGAIAGACAEVVTYPLEVVRRQLQLQQMNSKMGLIAVFQQIIERDGFTALFSGVVPSTVQVLPSAALSYLVYESMKTILKAS